MYLKAFIQAAQRHGQRSSRVASGWDDVNGIRGYLGDGHAVLSFALNRTRFEPGFSTRNPSKLTVSPYFRAPPSSSVELKTLPVNRHFGSMNWRRESLQGVPFLESSIAAATFALAAATSAFAANAVAAHYLLVP